MENQEQKPVNAPSESGEKKNEHRRRHHRGGKQHTHPHEQRASQENNSEGGSKQIKEAALQKNESNGEGRAQGEGHSKRHPQKQKNRDRRNQESRQSAPATEESSQGNQQGDGEKKKHNNQGNKKGRNQQRNQRKGNRDNRSHGGAKFTPSSSIGLYEDAEKEAQELAQLRAKIVLSSATAKEEPSVQEIPFNAVPLKEAKEQENAGAEAVPAMEEPSTPVQPVEEKEQVEVVGIRFRSSSKTYFFAPQGITAKLGDSAIVETARGPEFGEVCRANGMVNVSETVSPLRPLLRIATKEDIKHNEENRKKEDEALGICQEKIRKHGLEMKLIDVQYAFDNSKLLFYFTAEGRVDFRELVKDLASVFHTRIELRQIGIRDETKMLGGIGTCGRTLCCSTFLPDFAQVSIKMAKEQGLSLNSAKISGVCGRLMCCLRYESEVYSEEIKKTPAVDSTVKTEDGVGRVMSINPLAGTVRVLFQNGQDTSIKQYHRSEVTVLEKERKAPAEKQEKKAEKKNSDDE